VVVVLLVVSALQPLAVSVLIRSWLVDVLLLNRTDMMNLYSHQYRRRLDCVA
jgi:hypothetical protein